MVLAVALLPLAGSALFLGANMSVTPGSPQTGSTVTVAGSCGTAGFDSSVSFSLLRGGITLNIPGSASTNSSGGFNTTLTIPASYGSGQATLVATCTRSGDTLSSGELAISAPPGTQISLISPGTAAIGSTITVVGTCPAVTNTGNASFSLAQSSVIRLLPAVGTAIATDGSFRADVGLVASSISSPGQAILFVTCPDNSTASANITLLAAPGTAPVTPTPTPTAPVDTEDTTPVGGVAAGQGPLALQLAAVILALAGFGLTASLLRFKRL